MHTVDVKPPPFDELLNVTIDELLDWDPVVNIRKTPMKTDSSYKEQLFAVKVCVESINSYIYLMNNGFAKKKVLQDFLVAEKHLS